MKTIIQILFISLFTLQNLSAQEPSVEYMAHVRTDGWNQGWVSNGQIAGRAARVPAREVILNFGDGSPLIVQEKGDVKDDTKRIEGIKIRLVNAGNASIKYKAHVQSQGWQEWVKNGELAGTEGKSKRLEAIIIELENLPGYTVKYKVRYESKNDLDKTIGQALQEGHIPTVWSNWMNEGDVAGTVGESRRLSHIMIALVKI